MVMIASKYLIMISTSSVDIDRGGVGDGESGGGSDSGRAWPQPQPLGVVTMIDPISWINVIFELLESILVGS